jgi:septum formation protein
VSADVPALILASASPRRQDILRSLGIEFSVQPVAVDEQRTRDESPDNMVRRLARAKAAAAEADPRQLVIGADTAVVLGDEVLGKPRDEADAIAMLLRLSGKTHRVLTGVALRGPTGVADATSCTTVTFREISRDEACDYWHSGEPADKAGAYGIQGRGGVFVERLEGSYSGVVGLPVFETAELLREAGVNILETKITT